MPLKEVDMSETKPGCFMCQVTDDQNVLIPCRKEGKELWVCVRCLPPLIHGQH